MQVDGVVINTNHCGLIKIQIKVCELIWMHMNWYAFVWMHQIFVNEWKWRIVHMNLFNAFTDELTWILMNLHESQ